MQESTEAYGKNWMHFVYKTDNLLRRITVSYGNSSITKGLHFFWNYLNPLVFLCSKCTIQSHIINLQPFLTSFVIFHALLIILSYKTMKLKSIWNELWKGSKLAWYHHFRHIACASKYRGLRQKMDALRVQSRQSPSKYQDFIRKLICYNWISFCKTYLNSWLFVCWKCTIQSHIIIFQSFLTSFVISHPFTNYFEL